jgi:hypothetical protein
MADVRASFWVVGLRRLAKRVKLECVWCQRMDALSCTRPPAPLPAARVTEAPPFSVTGLDYAGPIFCADVPGQKFYVLLFTCGVVRAVHLELTDSLSLDAFVLAFRRFVGRRGIPSIIYSDNAKTFHAAKARLHSLLGVTTPRWQFILPTSPCWGGWWEQLVGSTKSALKKSVRRSCVTRSELVTTLVEIESAVNSRPLVLAGDDAEEITLTPNHFLLGKMASFSLPMTSVPNAEVTGKELRGLNKAQSDLLGEFWRCWSTGYLQSLPPIVAQFRSRGVVHPGSVVLVREDNVPRLQWPLGVVEEVFPGKDGLVRSVKVKMARGSFLRPIQRLHCLEIPEVSDIPSSDQPAPVNAEPATNPDVPTAMRRSKRAVRRPDRLDL